jgi:hypothetical protein
MEYIAKIFVNETQVSLNLIFNSLQLKRFFDNLEQGDIVRYIGEASNAEETTELLGLNQLKNSDRELYFYISATFVSLATMTNETDIYRKTLQSILEGDFEKEGESLTVNEFIKNSLKQVKTLYQETGNVLEINDLE